MNEVDEVNEWLKIVVSKRILSVLAGINGNILPKNGGDRMGNGAFSQAAVLGDFLLVVVVVVLMALFERLRKAVRSPKVARIPVRSSEVERKE